MYFGEYDNDGRVISIGQTTQLNFELNSQSKNLIELPEFSWDYYCDGGNIYKKQLLILTHPISAPVNTDITISNIPNPCDVTWPDGEVTTVTDGEVVLNVDLVGSYTFKFDSIPHLIDDVTIEVTV